MPKWVWPSMNWYRAFKSPHYIQACTEQRCHVQTIILSRGNTISLTESQWTQLQRHDQTNSSHQVDLTPEEKIASVPVKTRPLRHSWLCGRLGSQPLVSVHPSSQGSIFPRERTGESHLHTWVVCQCRTGWCHYQCHRCPEFPSQFPKLHYISTRISYPAQAQELMRFSTFSQDLPARMTKWGSA